MGYLLLAMIGLLGGIVSGLFGVGGGIVFVPLLILLRSFEPHLAIATSLAAIVPTAMTGVFRHSRGTVIDWQSALFLAAFGVAGAWLGGSLSLQLSALLLRRLYALFLLLLAFKMFFPN